MFAEQPEEGLAFQRVELGQVRGEEGLFLAVRERGRGETRVRGEEGLGGGPGGERVRDLIYEELAELDDAA